MPQTARELENDALAIQQVEPEKISSFGARLSQPLLVPPATFVPTTATYDLSVLDLAGLELLNGGVTEVVTGATTNAVTLPLIVDAPNDWTHTFIVLDGATNNLTLNRSGADTILGAPAVVMQTDTASVTIYRRADDTSTDWFALTRG